MKRTLSLIGIILICFFGFVFIMMFIRGEEDTWLNVNGNWVKHGMPSAPPPRCGIENCHGLDIICGPNPPDFCTEIYKLGDFCRQFASCGIVGGGCVLLTDDKFEPCKDCVIKCQTIAGGYLDDGSKAFECEDICRQQFQ